MVSLRAREAPLHHPPVEEGLPSQALTVGGNLALNTGGMVWAKDTAQVSDRHSPPSERPPPHSPPPFPSHPATPYTIHHSVTSSVSSMSPLPSLQATRTMSILFPAASPESSMAPGTLRRLRMAQVCLSFLVCESTA